MTTEQLCPVCGRQFVPVLARREDFAERRLRWKNGALIQDVWPEATAIEREQIITGVCSDACWEALFPEEEES